MLDFQGSWDEHLDLIEFSYNNSYHTSIQMAPYKALYEQKCRNPLCWEDAIESVTFGPQYLQEMVEKIKLIQGRMRVAEDRQKSYTNQRRRPMEFQICEKVNLTIFHLMNMQKVLGVQISLVCANVTGVAKGVSHKGSDKVWKEGKVKPPIHWTIRCVRENQ